MILHKSTFIWLAFYAIVLTFVMMQYIDIMQVDTLNSQMFDDLMIRPQKLLFNTTIFFIFLIYVTRKEFLNPLLLVRYKHKLSIKIIKYGLIISALFVFLSLLLIFVVSKLFGLVIIINNDFLFLVLKLMLYCVFVYMTYILVYLMTNKKVLSLLINLATGLILLVLFHGIVFVSVITDYTMIVNLYWLILLTITPILIFINLLIGKRREFIT